MNDDLFLDSSRECVCGCSSSVVLLGTTHVTLEQTDDDHPMMISPLTRLDHCPPSPPQAELLVLCHENTRIAHAIAKEPCRQVDTISSLVQGPCGLFSSFALQTRFIRDAGGRGTSSPSSRAPQADRITSSRPLTGPMCPQWPELEHHY